MDIENAKALIMAECTRIIEILKTDKISEGCKVWDNPFASEVKCKMAELRRDTLRLEKILYHPEEFKNGWRI